MIILLFVEMHEDESKDPAYAILLARAMLNIGMLCGLTRFQI